MRPFQQTTESHVTVEIRFRQETQKLKAFELAATPSGVVTTANTVFPDVGPQAIIVDCDPPGCTELLITTPGSTATGVGKPVEGEIDEEDI